MKCHQTGKICDIFMPYSGGFVSKFCYGLYIIAAVIRKILPLRAMTIGTWMKKLCRFQNYDSQFSHRAIPGSKDFGAPALRLNTNSFYSLKVSQNLMQ